MSLAYAAPASLAGAAVVTPAVNLSWNSSPLLGTPTALLNFGTALYTDAAGIVTWAGTGTGGTAFSDIDYHKPSGGLRRIASGTAIPPISDTEKATDNGTGSLLFNGPVGSVGANKSILYSQYSASLNPGNTDWTIECFIANGQPIISGGIQQGSHFGSRNPVIWFINDSNVNGIGNFGYQLQRDDWGDTGGTVKFYVLNSTGSAILGLDTGLAFVNWQWYHVAVSKHGNDFQVFVDGVLKASGTVTGYYNGDAMISLGDTYLAFAGFPPLGGWMDEFRYVRGHTVYWDDTYGVPQHDVTGFSQGYVVYRDGVQYATVDNLDVYHDAAVVPGLSYAYKVAAWDGVSRVSDFSAEITVQVPVGPPETAVYGKFAGARAFAPINIANMRGVRPRVYMPLEDTTVRTGK